MIYQAPRVEPPPVRGRGERASRRKRQARAQAEAHRTVESRILDAYFGNSNRDLNAQPIGGSSLPVITVQVTPRSLLHLAEQPDVVAILPNQRIHLIRPRAIQYDELARNEVRGALTWGLEQIGVPKLWEKTKGAGVTVGVLDTGVFGAHPALDGKVSEFVMIDPLGRRITASPMFDASGHGTHVTGTIVGGQTPEGVSIGVAPDATAVVGAVLVGDTTIRTLLEGIDWCIEKGADVVNLSLGFNYFEPLFTEVFDILTGQYEILPVVAIGNENLGNSSSPGNVPNAVGVGAVEKMGRARVEVAFFSSGASLVFPSDAKDTIITKPDVVAPGVQVYSCIPPVLRGDGAYLYAYMDGTSMATPHVAGVAALLMAAQPKASIPDVAQAIKESAKHPGGNGYRPDNRWGYGLVQAEEAYRALGCK